MGEEGSHEDHCKSTIPSHTDVTVAPLLLLLVVVLTIHLDSH